MIWDITGVMLLPGNGGRDCPGNGNHSGIECCCDECDYMMCCLEKSDSQMCFSCKDRDCPHSHTFQ